MEIHAFPAHPSNANVVVSQELLCMSRSLCLPSSLPCDSDSLEPVTSSLIASPFWLGDAVIPMLLIWHAPAQHPRPLLLGYRVHTLLCRGSGLPIFFLLSPANVHDAPFAQPLLAWAVHLYQIRPRIIRLDAAYWGLRLIAWIHAVLGAVAVIPWNPKRQKNRSCLPPTWTKEELGKRSAIERFFGRVFLFFHEALSSSFWLVHHRPAGCSDVHRYHHRRFGCST